MAFSAPASRRRAVVPFHALRAARSPPRQVAQRSLGDFERLPGLRLARPAAQRSPPGQRRPQSSPCRRTSPPPSTESPIARSASRMAASVIGANKSAAITRTWRAPAGIPRLSGSGSNSGDSSTACVPCSGKLFSPVFQASLGGRFGHL